MACHNIYNHMSDTSFIIWSKFGSLLEGLSYCKLQFFWLDSTSITLILLTGFYLHFFLMQQEEFKTPTEFIFFLIFAYLPSLRNNILGGIKRREQREDDCHCVPKWWRKIHELWPLCSCKRGMHRHGLLISTLLQIWSRVLLWHGRMCSPFAGSNL